MKKYISSLKRTQLFSGIGEEDIASLLTCLGARQRSYKKGEYILSRGKRLSDMFVLLNGKVHVQTDDYWGNRSILSSVESGETFGEAYAFQGSGVLLNDVVAALDCDIILLDVRRVLTTCSSACRFHTMIVQNLFFTLSEKNRNLVQKLGYMSGRTTRAKLISYLSDESKKQGSSSFTIPFNRQQLADYLSVDRSAMSNELCKMRDEGLLKFEKNRFMLCDPK